MGIKEVRKLQREVTEEPFVLGPSIRGRELAGLRRRGVAFALDGVLIFLLGTPVLLLAALAAIYVQTPTMARSVVGLMGGGQLEDSARGFAEIATLAARRSPGAVPPYLAEALSRGDLDEIERLIEEQPLAFAFDLGKGGPSYYDAIEGRLFLYRDVLFGRLASVAGYVAFGIAYFTVASWIGRGRTPGKWLLGIRTANLDGRKLSLNDAFGRAGGYTASFSTLGLGLIQAIRDPNRQALHDKVAQTVVLREPRRSLLPWRNR